MKLFVAAFALVASAGVWSNGSVEVQTGFVHAREAFASPMHVGPVPHRYNVLVRSADDSISGFKVAISYEHNGERRNDVRVIPNVPDHGSVASFAVPEVGIRINTQIAELRESRSFDVPTD
jgi:hypothetical protein